MTGPGPSDNLTKFPKGLISALGLRDFGSAPHTLSNSLLGVIESRDMYLLNDRELVSATVIAGAVGGSNICSIVVPPGEVWYVWAFQVGCDTPVGGTIEYCACTGYDLGSQFFALTPYVSIIASQFSRVASDTPFFAGAGGVFGAHVKSVVGAANPLVCNAFITRLRT